MRESRAANRAGTDGPKRSNVDCTVGHLRLLFRPLGSLTFAVALLALRAAAVILGERDELGFFAGRLARMLCRYPELTRTGVEFAWLLWAMLLALALSPLDPIASWWDEVVLGALGLGAVWTHLHAEPPAGR